MQTSMEEITKKEAVERCIHCRVPTFQELFSHLHHIILHLILVSFFSIDEISRYETCKRTLQAQLAKNEQSFREDPSDFISLKGLHTRLQEIQV